MNPVLTVVINYCGTSASYAIVDVTYGAGQAILTSELLQSSWPELWRPIRGTPCRNLSTSPSACPGWPKLHVKSHNCGRHLGLRVRPGDQPTVFPVDEPNNSTTEEGEAGPQRAKKHAHRFLWNSQGCSPWISYPGPRPSTPNSTAMFWGVWGRTIGENGLNSGARAREFLGRTGWWHYSTHLTRQIWPLATSSSSRRWRCSWRIAVSHRGGHPVGITVSAMTRALGARYRCTRGLFWRECCPNWNQVSTLLHIGLVSEPFHVRASVHMYKRRPDTRNREREKKERQR